jgi:pimeloyl-ACP methyl ester carboxylesterase
MTIFHKSVQIEGLDIFFREAGSRDNPAILLLHGFPSSSRMFRNLMRALADQFFLVAPDYPGFGNSSMPLPDQFVYTFDHLAAVLEDFLRQIGLKRFSLYVMDYGAPVGYRLAVRRPEMIQALIVQNGNAYEEGLGEFWKPLKAYWANRSQETEGEIRKFLTLESTRWQYIHGTRNRASISPDNWLVDSYLLDRPGNKEIQLELFYDYRTNPEHYPAWQAYFKQQQPPTLVVWGRNDPIFPAAGAYPYLRDLGNIEFHLLDTGHFALEEDGDLIAYLIRRFLSARLKQETPKLDRT